MQVTRPPAIFACAIVLGAAVSLAAPGARAQCLISDNFSGTNYGPQWSKFDTQDGEAYPYIANIPVPSTSNVPGRYLVVGASAYPGGADLWPDTPTPNYLGSVFLQQVNPNADWTITTEIAAYAPPGYKSSAGLVLVPQPLPLGSLNNMWRVAEYDSAPPVNGESDCLHKPRCVIAGYKKWFNLLGFI